MKAIKKDKVVLDLTKVMSLTKLNRRKGFVQSTQTTIVVVVIDVLLRDIKII